MKRGELKDILKECLSELFEENDFFMRLVTESIKASVTATLKESLSQLPNSTTPNIPSSKRKGLIDKKGFNPAAFFQEGGLASVKEIMTTKSELHEEQNEHQTMLKKLNEKIPDEMIFGNDFKTKIQAHIKKR